LQIISEGIEPQLCTGGETSVTAVQSPFTVIVMSDCNKYLEAYIRLFFLEFLESPLNYTRFFYLHLQTFKTTLLIVNQAINSFNHVSTILGIETS